MVVDMVEKFLHAFAKRLQERGGKWEREAAARVAWGHAPALPFLLYRRGGAALGVSFPLAGQP